jgi:hypothetical protein
MMSGHPSCCRRQREFDEGGEALTLDAEVEPHPARRRARQELVERNGPRAGRHVESGSRRKQGKASEDP